MERIIDELRRRSEKVPVPLELPDMDDIIDAEEQLFISLDGACREFLLAVSDVVYGSLEPVTVADPNSHTYLPEVAATAWSLGVPRDLIPICEKQGNYYCADENGEIVFWENGELSDEQPWKDIWEWAEWVWLKS
jgi:hypothetical protein